ncbi:MAG: hypothetical protein WB800_30565 [Streptosporangiaceae bacterium]
MSSRVATAESAEDCSGLKTPGGKKGTSAMPRSASSSISLSSWR